MNPGDLCDVCPTGIHTPEAHRERLWWCSFAEDSGFLGVCIIRGHNFWDALRIAHETGVNPGGEVASFEIEDDGQVPEDMIGRLLQKDELIARGLIQETT